MDINKRMKSYLDKHKSGRKKTTLTILLSILVALSVVSSLIMPAISMTIDTLNISSIVSTEKKAPAALDGTNMLDLTTAESWGAYIDVNGTQIYNNMQSDVIISNDITVSSDTANISAGINYEFTTDVKSFLANETGPHLAWDLGVLNITASFEDSEGNAMDHGIVTDPTSKYGEYRADYIAGTYVIENGIVKITLNSEYISYVNSGTGNIKGSLQFNGELSRSESADGDQSFVINGQKVTVDFPDHRPDVTNKNATINTSTGMIDWTITIHNQYKVDLSNYSLTDDMLENASNITFNPSDVGQYDSANKKITFNSSSADHEWISISYSTPITTDNLKGTSTENTATLKSDIPDDTFTDTFDGEANFPNTPFNVEKNGTPDYNNGSYSNKINWTITINSNYGTSLDGYIISDNKLPESGVTITPAGATLTKNSDNKWVLGNTNGNKQIKITYQTDAVANGTNENTVELFYPDGATTNAKKDESVNYKSESELVTLGKNGTYSRDFHEITWDITITPHDGYSLKGYEITDEQFPDSLDEVTFNPSWVKGIAELSNNKITFNDDCTSSVTLTYTTEVEIPSGTQTTIVSNSVSDNKASTTVTETVSVENRNELTKSINSSQSETVPSNGQIDRTINWQANITLDGKFSDKVYTDTLSVTGDGATHTISDEQLAALTVYARVYEYDQETLLTAGTDYTVAKTDTGFTITFSETLDTAGYNYVKINYSTTASSAASTTYDTSYKFTNSGSFNGKSATNEGFTLYRTNPEINNEMSLTINKSWESDTESDRPSEINVKVYYQTNTNQTWRTIKTSADGTLLFDDDEGYSSADDYVVTLNSSGSWTTTLNNLPQEIAKTNADGSRGESTYYSYKIVELAADGTELSNNSTFDVANGFYKVTYSNENGLRYTGSLTIYNKLYANTSVTPIKNWTGDAGSGNDVTSITMSLEYCLKSNWTWHPVKIDANNNYIFDGGGSTADATEVTQEITGTTSWVGAEWSNLPTAIVVDGNVQELAYRVREIKINDKEIIGNRFTSANGYYTVSYNSDNVTVNNYFTKTVDYEIGAVKVWANDTDYSETNRPDSITVQLQQKALNSNEWLPYTAEGVESTQVLNDANDWTAKNWTGLPNQLVDEDTGEVISYTYRVVELSYTFNGNTYELSNNVFATTSDGKYTISYKVNEWTPNNELSSSGTVTITNTFEPVGTIEITPQKKWVGDTDFSAANRPQSVTFTLQQKLDGGDWTDYKVEGNVVTVTLTSDNPITSYDGTVTWSGAKVSNLPDKVITVSDGTFTETRCYYRFVETSYVDANGNNQTIASGATEFKTENGKYTISSTAGSIYNTGNFEITNTFKESIGIEKYVLDSTGNPITSIDKDQLSSYIKKINGEEYYVFNWQLTFEGKKGSDISPAVDTLPEGFSLCRFDTITFDDNNHFSTLDNAPNISWDTTSTIQSALTLKLNGKAIGYYAGPVITWDKQGTQFIKTENSIIDAWKKPNTSPARYYYDEATRKVYFGKPWVNSDSGGVYHITYSTKIPKEDLDAKILNGSYTITNNAERYDIPEKTDANMSDTDYLKNVYKETPTGQTASASLKISSPVDTDLISKTYSKTLIPGYIKYSLIVNPEGKNLSNGDTIDIKDIFETVSYLDHDYNGGETTYDKNLVDVLMNSIKLYEIDANGNKIELDSSKYTMTFESNANLEDGAALLKLTIPDEKRIQIDYEYKLIANEKTPSVIHGCKSSTRVNGLFATMQPGLVPPKDDEITFSNKAELISDSATATAKHTNELYKVFSSSGTISTNSLPKIQKVKTGDYTINDLKASFLLGKYENGKWYYATAINTDSKSREITWSTDGFDGTKIDANAMKIDVESAYEVALDENTLYKLVEVSVPSDYEGANLGLTDVQFQELITNYLNDGTTLYNSTDYKIFLEKFVSTHYFAYNSTIASLPSNITSSDVIQIKSGGDIEIPNNELIDIGVEKEWVSSTGTIENSQITVELYWSYTKSATGMPDDAVLATAADLGIMDENFSAQKTITVGDDNSRVWQNLPNGKNDKPIYYYIKETGYTINGTAYNLDSNGEFKSASDEKGSYLPIYIGNATNADTTITVKNTQQLMLKKEWKNSANDPLKNIPVQTIILSIYGVDSDGRNSAEPIFKDIELKSSENWQRDISSLITDPTILSQYSSFAAVEKDNAALGDFVVSCVFNLNAQTGEIIVSNKSTAPSEASVTVNKVWSDGAEVHANESIKVTLYQLQTRLTDINDLSELTDEKIMQTVDSSDKQIYQNLELNAANNWSYTWTGLPLEDDNQNRYYYYVKEDMSEIADAEKYTANYTVKNSSISKSEYTVTNTRQSLTVQKLWLDEAGNIISDSDLAIEDITLTLKTKGGPLTDSEDMFQPDGCHPDNAGYATIAQLFYEAIDNYYSNSANEVHADGLNIVTVGDSITYGYKDADYNETVISYPTTLATLMSNGGYTATIKSNATSGYQLKDFWYTDVNTDTDVVCLLGGTNDIHQSQSAVQGDPKAVYQRLTAVIDAIRIKSPDCIVFVATIPYFDFYSDAGTITEGGGWWPNSSSYYNENQAFADLCNGLIDEYNYGNPNDSTQGYIMNLPNVYTNLYTVDVCAALPLEAIGTDVGTITLNKNNNWVGVFDISDTDTSIQYYVEETEVPNGWIVEYENEYLTLGSSTPFVVKNTRNIPKTSITVEKTWENDEMDTSQRASIKLSLLRKTDSTDWYELETAMPTPTQVDNVWTYTYTNLPAEDNAGNTYYYKVKEAPLDGYTVSYGNGEDGIASGTLTITNTRAISININKQWSDIDTNTHIADIVKLRIYRTTNSGNINTEEVELILKIAETAAVGVGKDITLTANKKLTEAKSADESIATVTLNDDGSITITGVGEGNVNITVSDGIDEKTINVTVSALEMFLNNDNVFTIEAGSDGTLSAKKSGSAVDATFTSSNTSILSVDGTTLRANAIGNADITATYDGLSVTQNITVTLPATFSITGSKEVTIGNTITLGVDKKFGTFTWESLDTSKATVNPDTGVVTGVAAGEVTIRATRIDDNVTADYKLNVVNGDIFENSNVVVQVPVGESVTIRSATYINQVKLWSSEIATTTISSDGYSITITGNKVGTTGEIEVAGGNWSKTTKFTIIVYDKLSVTPSSKILEYGSSVTLTYNQTGTIEYNIVSGANLIEISGNTVTAKSGTEGTAVIEATNTSTNETVTITIDVVAEIPQVVIPFSSTGDLSYDTSKTIESVVLKVNHNAGTWEYVTLKFDDENYIKVGYYNGSEFEREEESTNPTNFTAQLDTSNGQVTITFIDDYQPEKIEIYKIDNSASGTVTVTYASASATNLSPMSLSLDNPEILSGETATPTALNSTTFTPDAENPNIEYIEIELLNTSGQNWQAVVENLPVYDPNGNAYLYWVDEVSSHSGYKDSYLYDDGDDNSNFWINASESNSNGEFNITVKNTKVKQESVILPNTGGNGTKWYYLAGLALTLCSIVALTVLKRKQRANV